MKYLYILLFAAVVFGACKKLPVQSAQFDVSVSKTTYKVGDTVNFVFSGNPDIITFYSGEAGLNYNYVNRTSADGDPQLQFTSYLQNPGEINTLRLMASTDFNGALDTSSVRSATWTDITSRAVLSSGTDNTASGVVGLADFLPAGKPLFLAFKYQGYTSATLKQPSWTIRTFNVNNVLPDKSSLINTADVTGWVALDFKNPTTVWSINGTGLGQVTINGASATSVNTNNEDWVISKPLDLKAVVPDLGVALKNVSGSTLTGYAYKYTKAGTYTASFLATDANSSGQNSVVRQIQITVGP